MDLDFPFFISNLPNRVSRNLIPHLWARLQLRAPGCTGLVAAFPRAKPAILPQSPADLSAPCTSFCASSTLLFGTQQNKGSWFCTVRTILSWWSCRRRIF